eukprot:scaffold42_cov77-Skeletonema_marinoi.AAC.8
MDTPRQKIQRYDADHAEFHHCCLRKYQPILYCQGVVEFHSIVSKMVDNEDVGKTPSVDSPSKGVKSAAGINDLENVPANNNNNRGDNDEAKCCASCGVVEVDDVKLKNCTACYLVRYCSVKCQKDHRPNHKRQCKKRAAELRVLRKVICHGCAYVNALREAEASLDQRCPFCRKPVPSSNDEGEKYMMKRIEANDPVTLHQEGREQYEKGNYSSAFEYYTKAAELGDVEAQFQLARLYKYGHGVEKDRGKVMYHLEEAISGGHPGARHNLGCEEEENGNIKRAVKHWIISATQGHDGSIKALMNAFKRGLISKEEIAATLRAHQAAVDATKSPQREAADEYYLKLDNMHSC